MSDTRILIVEDEERLAEVLKKQLEDSGFTAEVAYDGYVGRMMAAKTSYSLIILDINIPLVNGYDLCREIREVNKQVPIIMLTALGSMDHKMAGFDVGADDYLLKPFDFRELLARIHVFIRRAGTPACEKLRIADLEMDLSTKIVQRAGIRIDLTSKETQLLEMFLMNQDKLLTREFIFEYVWGLDFDPGTNIIDVYVNYLRKKIDRDFQPKLIHTRFGFGFYCSEKEL